MRRRAAEHLRVRRRWRSHGTPSRGRAAPVELIPTGSRWRWNGRARELRPEYLRSASAANTASPKAVPASPLVARKPGAADALVGVLRVPPRGRESPWVRDAAGEVG